MQVTETIKYVGVNDHDIDLFEGQYDVRENGMAYNSYVVIGEKVAVADTVDARFVDEWLGNVETALDGRTPDYLVVHHMEPDHSAGIVAFMDRYPDAQVVASKMAFKMMAAYFGTDFSDRQIVCKEGFELDLGGRTLRFIGAANVHWPEVMFSYDSKDKVLFSADAFGKFGANDIEDPEGWACEARRYYFGIVGKFGKNVQAVLQKVAAFDVERICPLHGPALSENLAYYVETYTTWAHYEPENSGVTIAYASVYGHTKQAAEELACALEEKGQTVSLFDLARDDMAEAVEDAFRYDRLVLASITYAGDIFPFMTTFIHTLAEHAYQNRKVAFIESGTWAPVAAKAMRAQMEQLAGIEFAETVVTVRGSVDDAARAQIAALANELASQPNSPQWRPSCLGWNQDTRAKMRDSRKCVHQKKGARTFWTATWLAPKGMTLRRRLRHSPRHIAKLRADKVQQSAKREIKRRYRVVQSFRSRELMLRLSRASLMEAEGQWC